MIKPEAPSHYNAAPRIQNQIILISNELATLVARRGILWSRIDGWLDALGKPLSRHGVLF